MHPVIKQILDSKRAMPLLSFPSVQLLGVPVGRLVNDSELQQEAESAVESHDCILDEGSEFADDDLLSSDEAELAEEDDELL